MTLEILQVPDCPNATALRFLLASLVRGGTPIKQHVVRDESEAATLGMRGSPTLLVDGTDRFAVAGMPAGLSCRLYRRENGVLSGIPSRAQLRAALTRKGPDDD